MRGNVSHAVASDVGLKRENNEDSYAIADLGRSFPCALIIADGMGGHRHGELASRIAVDYSQEQLCRVLEKDSNPDTMQQILADICEKANIKVYLGSLDRDDCNGMGTTLTIAVIYEDQLILAHVGDCRAYLYRDKALMRLTIDHTLVQEMIDAGSLSEADSRTHPRRNVLTRALGSPENVKADTIRLPLKRGDRIMLCTDGLHGAVSEAEILTVLNEEDSSEQAVNKLIALANEKGGEDNITVLMFSM